jgi:hypothetical protein
VHRPGAGDFECCVEVRRRQGKYRLVVSSGRQKKKSPQKDSGGYIGKVLLLLRAERKKALQFQ